MNQKNIKIPFTCSHLKKGLYLILIIGSITSLIISNGVSGNFHLFTWGFIGLIGSLIIAFHWWMDRSMDGKETFPFRFSCKCEE